MLNKKLKTIAFMLVSVFLLGNIPMLTANAEIINSQDADRLENLATNEIVSLENPAIIVSGSYDTAILSEDYESQEFSQLPDYNDGLIACLNTDTQIVNNYTVQLEQMAEVYNLLSRGAIGVSAPDVVIGEMVIAYNDIHITSTNLSSLESFNVIYSMSGNVSIDTDGGIFKGVIYAPNGEVSIASNSFELDGHIVAESVDINCPDFECAFNPEINHFCNVLSAIDLNLLASEELQYGEFYTDINYDLLAVEAIAANIDGVGIEDITISDQIALYDAKDIVNNYGYNFSVNNGMRGYIVLGAQSKTNLVNDFCLGGNLRTDCKVYCFSGCEIYFQEVNGYTTTNGTIISNEDFLKYKTEKASYALNVDESMLSVVQDANERIILSAEESSDGSFDVALLSSTHYEGTDANAYGYGGISSITSYLKSRYGGTPSVVDSGKSLVIDTQTMSGVSGKSANNCSLVAISKVLKYYQSQKSKSGIDSKIGDIYNVVETIGVGYGYTDNAGTGATKINNITHDAFKHYGYDSTCNGVYIWSFTGEVKSEINAERPVIMNIARGYYGNHSVTVAGYCVYKTNNKEYSFIKIVDGWEAAYRYIDYEAFAYDLATSGFGSFNTATVK